jgi:hypothetical protein
MDCGLWIVGTHRRLSVVDDDLDKLLMEKGWENWSAFADFSVCPLTQYEKGHMQSVCIRSYTNLRFKRRN